MSETQALAALPQQTLEGWHRFVASGDRDLLVPLLAEHIVFRSPFVQSPIPGRPATLLVLTTVVQIFENFRYHRTFVAGSHDVALGDRHMAGQNDEHAGAGLAGFEQCLAMPVRFDVAEPAHARDFLRRQRRECLLATRKCGCGQITAIRLLFCRGVHAHFCSLHRKETKPPRAGPSASHRGFNPDG